MKERRRKTVVITVTALILALSLFEVMSAKPQVRVTQEVGFNNWETKEGDIYWAITDVNRVGPGGYTPITWCIENEDEDFGLKNYYVTFILDPEKTMGGINWDTVREESNGPTGYRWTFGDNIKYAIANTYLLALMGNYAKDIFNVFSSKSAEKIDLDVCLAITDQEPEDPTFFSKFLEENIFGVTIQIPDLEPVTRAGKHSWCVEEGFDLKWYERISLSGIRDKHSYALPYIVVGSNARIGEEHKLVALVCSADPDSMWQWSSFNIISYEELTFVIEKPNVSQTLGIGLFVCFALGYAWYKGWLKKIPKLG